MLTQVLSWACLLGVGLVEGGGLFSKTCKAVNLTSNGLLTADCTAINGTHCDSQLDLGSCYANLQGKLSPVKDGKAFFKCGGCLAWMDPSASPPMMLGACPWSGGVNTQAAYLDDMVYNDDGVLGCFDGENASKMNTVGVALLLAAARSQSMTSTTAAVAKSSN